MLHVRRGAPTVVCQQHGRGKEAAQREAVAEPAVVFLAHRTRKQESSRNGNNRQGEEPCDSTRHELRHGAAGGAGGPWAGWMGSEAPTCQQTDM